MIKSVNFVKFARVSPKNGTYKMHSSRSNKGLGTSNCYWTPTIKLIVKPKWKKNFLLFFPQSLKWEALPTITENMSDYIRFWHTQYMRLNCVVAAVNAVFFNGRCCCCCCCSVFIYLSSISWHQYAINKILCEGKKNCLPEKTIYTSFSDHSNIYVIVMSKWMDSMDVHMFDIAGFIYMQMHFIIFVRRCSFVLLLFFHLFLLKSTVNANKGDDHKLMTHKPNGNENIENFSLITQTMLMKQLEWTFIVFFEICPLTYIINRSHAIHFARKCCTRLRYTVASWF